MTPSHTVFRARRVVSDHGPHGPVGPASVHVQNGTVRALRDYDDVPHGAPLVDLGDLVLSPGVVDSHVHINEPGRTHWEGFVTATRAAAAGGVTTLVDMPLNSIPPTTSVENLHLKASALAGHAWVDVGLWGGVIPGNSGVLRDMLDAGALGFKCFMVDSGVEEFPHVSERDLREAMGVLADTAAPLLAHAELSGPIEAALAAAGLLERRRYEGYLASRPMEAEDQAIELLYSLCRETGARVHVVHLSSSNALATLRRARDASIGLSAETTHHYLHFAADEIADGATEFKCAPPIRDAVNREKLWRGLFDGDIDLVVSDHSPCTPELKKLPEGDFSGAWGGIASLQFGLSILWTQAQARGRTLSDVARWLSERPAALAGLSKRKGTIAPGRDADFVAWNPDEAFVVTEDLIEHRHKVTPYLGRTLKGSVHGTWLRGARVFTHENGARAIGAEPSGQWIKRG